MDDCLSYSSITNMLAIDLISQIAIHANLNYIFAHLSMHISSNVLIPVTSATIATVYKSRFRHIVLAWTSS